MSQLVICRTITTKTIITLYENGNQTFSFSGFTGKNGINRNIFEGSKTTPAGTFNIGKCFYLQEKPKTKLDCFKITPYTYWVDDISSPFYNTKQEFYHPPQISGEHMIDFPCYKYGFVIEYNTCPIKSGLGSAIFFHIGSHPTAGCIVTSERNVLKLIAILDKDKHPKIKIL